MKTFQSKINDVREEALSYILSVMKMRGTGYQLTDPANYEEEIDEEVYGLPRSSYLDRRMDYHECAIVMINIDNEDTLTFVGLKCFNEDDGEHEFHYSDVETETICLIADLVHKLEN